MVVPDGIFPCKLHDMLEYASRYNMEHVSIEWTLNGTAFIVNDPDGLMKILPLFFGQTKYRSFRRQLNIWSFERIDNGPKNKGAVFQHPYFIRGQKHICENMTRDSFKRSNTSTSSLSSMQYQQRSLSQQAIQQAHQAAKLQQQRQRLPAAAIVASDIMPSRSSRPQQLQTNISAPTLPFPGVVSGGCLEKLQTTTSHHHLVNVINGSNNNLMMSTKCTPSTSGMMPNASFNSSPNSAFGPRKVSACDSTTSSSSHPNLMMMNNSNMVISGMDNVGTTNIDAWKQPPQAPPSPMSSSMGSCGTTRLENGAPNEEWNVNFNGTGTINSNCNNEMINKLLQQQQFQPLPLHPNKQQQESQASSTDVDDDSLLEFAGKAFFFLEDDVNNDDLEPKKLLDGPSSSLESQSVSVVDDIVELFKGAQQPICL